MVWLFGENIKVCAKEGVTRIAEKLDEIQKEIDSGKKPAKNWRDDKNKPWQFISDLLRLSVFCLTPREVIDTIIKLLSCRDIFVVRLKPRFDKSFLQDMIVNFMWGSYSNMGTGVICELQIKLSDGSVSRGYYDQHFVYEVRRSLDNKDLFFVQEVITKRVNWLA